MSTNYLDEVGRLLDMPPGAKSDVMREIESHYGELQAYLVSTGMDSEQAARETERRLGQPRDISARLTAVHNTASWKSAIMAGLPFLALSVCALLARFVGSAASAWAMIVFAAVVTAGSIWQIARGQRPVWLATWLAAAVLAANQVIGYASTSRMSSELNFATRSGFLYGLCLCLLALLAARAAQRWVLAVAIWSTLLIACAWYLISSAPWHAQPYIPMIVSGLAAVILMLLFARSVLEVHDYGSPMLASLFMLAIMLLPLGQSIRLAPASGVASALAIVWLARASQRRQKILLANLALVLWALTNASQTWSSNASNGWFGGVLSLVFSAGISYCFVWPLVFIPIWLEDGRRRRQAFPPEVAA